MPKLDLNGNTVNVRDAGDGPPVILLHSSSSHSGQWKQLSDQISDKFRVLAPDLHGYGKSDPLPTDDRPYFRHDTAIVSMLMGMLDAPVHLVGHSLGGTIAVRSALERPERVVSLTLIEPVLFNLLEESEDPTRTEYLQLAHAMMVLVRFGDRERAARLFLDYWGGPGGLDGMDDDTRGYVVRTIDRVADDWFGISAYAPGALTAADLHAVSSPTLLLCGEKTRSSMRRISAILRKTLPEVEYREIPEAGHLSPITHPARVNEIVIEFLKRRTTDA
ncbi:MAG: alpha/beta hydrolase [Chloroflexi bacterium]|nr:alpha/beta hydrolase [Chloroflexota bacterium]